MVLFQCLSVPRIHLSGTKSLQFDSSDGMHAYAADIRFITLVPNKQVVVLTVHERSVHWRVSSSCSAHPSMRQPISNLFGAGKQSRSFSSWVTAASLADIRELVKFRTAVTTEGGAGSIACIFFLSSKWSRPRLQCPGRNTEIGTCLSYALRPPEWWMEFDSCAGHRGIFPSSYLPMYLFIWSFVYLPIRLFINSCIHFRNT